jgi:hypothetical protein
VNKGRNVGRKGRQKKRRKIEGRKEGRKVEGRKEVRIGVNSMD